MSAGPRPTREEVFEALFELLRTAEGFVTYSRRMADHSVIAPRLLPILILWELPEETDHSHRGTPRDYWNALIALIFQNESRPMNGDPTTAVAGATIINPLLDAVRTVLAPDDPTTNSLTLGGLVEWCRVEGMTDVETGDTHSAGVGWATLPIRILVP